MRDRRTTCLLGTLGAVVLAAPAAADLVGTAIELGPEQHPDGVTYRLYLVFDDEGDWMLAIGASPPLAPLVFATNGPDLLQNSALEGIQDFDDRPSFADLGGDSWVTVGGPDGNNTEFAPNFLDGDGMESVVNGSRFEQLDNGSYFDEEPATWELPDENMRILIAQFSVPAGTRFGYQGLAEYRHVDDPELVARPFFMQVCPGDVDASGAIDFDDLLAVLSTWGPYEPCPPFAPADMNQDCDVGFDDLLAVLRGWGPCTPVAACCFPDRTCADLSMGACFEAGGFFRGLDTTCADTKCD